MRVRIVSRASDLAVLQAELVARAFRERFATADVTRLTRSSEGDRDQRAALWAMPDKGVFTADLSRALVEDAADVAVHSWKDLPIVPPARCRARTRATCCSSGATSPRAGPTR